VRVFRRSSDILSAKSSNTSWVLVHRAAGCRSVEEKAYECQSFAPVLVQGQSCVSRLETVDASRSRVSGSAPKQDSQRVRCTLESLFLFHCRQRRGGHFQDHREPPELHPSSRTAQDAPLQSCCPRPAVSGLPTGLVVPFLRHGSCHRCRFRTHRCRHLGHCWVPIHQHALRQKPFSLRCWRYCDGHAVAQQGDGV
jgi:hypothetical protein